jgi:hypothetical protein
MTEMKHVGWIVVETHEGLCWPSARKARRQTMDAYTHYIKAELKQDDRSYANEKKLGYVDKCVKVFVEAPDEHT